MADLREEQLEAIADVQEAHFDEPTGQKNPDGTDIIKAKYQQVIPAKSGDLQVDVYDGPNGKGYVVVETKTDEQGTWTKATNYGNEDWRSHDWKLLTTK